jgi:hypothetical protein
VSEESLTPTELDRSKHLHKKKNHISWFGGPSGDQKTFASNTGSCKHITWGTCEFSPHQFRHITNEIGLLKLRPKKWGLQEKCRADGLRERATTWLLSGLSISQIVPLSYRRVVTKTIKSLFRGR